MWWASPISTSIRSCWSVSDAGADGERDAALNLDAVKSTFSFGDDTKQRPQQQKQQQQQQRNKFKKKSKRKKGRENGHSTESFQKRFRSH